MDELLNNTQEPLFDETKDYYDELVGEGKKFKDAKELAKSKALGDLYIKDIVRQKDDLAKSYVELKAQYDAQAKLTDLVDRIGNQRSSSDDNLNVTDNRTAPEKKSLDLNDIESWYNQREKTKVEQDNLNKAKSMLKEKLGTNYVNVIRERIESLDLTEDDVNSLAKRSPKTLAKVLGIEEEASNTTLFQAPPVSQRRNDSFKPTTQKRTWTYYQELKKTNPRLYIDPKIAIQMHNDHISLGSAFEDGDFHLNN
jgi:hypothetical protein